MDLLLLADRLVGEYQLDEAKDALKGSEKGMMSSGMTSVARLMVLMTWNMLVKWKTVETKDSRWLDIPKAKPSKGQVLGSGL